MGGGLGGAHPCSLGSPRWPGSLPYRVSVFPCFRVSVFPSDSVFRRGPVVWHIVYSSIGCPFTAALMYEVSVSWKSWDLALLLSHRGYTEREVGVLAARRICGLTFASGVAAFIYLKAAWKLADLLRNSPS